MKQLFLLFLSLSIYSRFLHAQPAKTPCPGIRSSMYFIDLDRKFDSCLLVQRAYHGLNEYPGSATFGYQPQYFFAADTLRLLKNPLQVKALKLEMNDVELAKVNFSRFPNLEYLWLEGPGRLTSGMAALKKLKVLLWNSGTLKSIPDNIGMFTSLEVFSVMRGSNLTYVSPSISKLKKLREFYLNYVDNLDTILVDYGNFSQLEKLSIFASIRSLINPSITKCKKLTHLRTVLIKPYIGELGNLKTLLIEYIKEEDDLTPLTKLQQLEEFSVSFGFNKDRIPKEIFALKKLRNLNLTFFNSGSNLHLSDGRLENLEYLRIGISTITSVPEFLYNSTKLRYLNFFSGTPVSFSDRLLHLPALQFVACSKNITFDFNTEQAKFEIKSKK